MSNLVELRKNLVASQETLDEMAAAYTKAESACIEGIVAYYEAKIVLHRLLHPYNLAWYAHKRAKHALEEAPLEVSPLPTEVS